jgi:hypothetical protein
MALRVFGVRCVPFLATGFLILQNRLVFASEINVISNPFCDAAEQNDEFPWGVRQKVAGSRIMMAVGASLAAGKSCAPGLAP